MISSKLGISCAKASDQATSADPSTLDTWRSKRSKTNSRIMSGSAVTGSQGNESEERIVDGVALEEVDPRNVTAGDHRSIDSETNKGGPREIQREIEITIEPPELLEQRRKSSKGDGFAYTNIWASKTEHEPVTESKGSANV